MSKLNISLIEKLLKKEIESLKSGEQTAESLWESGRYQETLDQIKELKNVQTPTLNKLGGNHLGTMREWIQRKCRNGEDVTWGSNDWLNFKDLTVQDMELLAASVASSTVRELFKG